MWTKEEEGFTFGIMRKLSLFSASASASACEVFRSNICILFLRALVPVVRFLEKRYFVTWTTFKEEKIKLGSKKSFFFKNILSSNFFLNFYILKICEKYYLISH
jgi:hypothetical protein